MPKAKFWISPASHVLAVGRVSRLQYFVFTLIYIATYFGALLGAMTLQASMTMQMEGFTVAAALTFTSYVCFCLNAKRLHDLNWPAFIAVIMFGEPLISNYIDLAPAFIDLPKVTPVPHIVNVVWGVGSGIAGLFLLFVPGNPGTNRYGPDPLRPPAPPIEVF